MKKVFGIYFSSPGVLDYPLNIDKFFQSYAEIIENIEKNGIKTVIVRNDSYLGNKEFSHYFIFNGKNYEEKKEKIKIDLLWNRDSENFIKKIDDLEVINNFDFDEICRDKLKTYELFKEFSAKTFLLNSYADLLKNIDDIKTDKIVLKPRFGERCEGIHIIKKDEIKPELYDDWTNILLQEFLDSSGGISGFVDGLHELNVYMINGEFAGARLKKPNDGSLICNISGNDNTFVTGLKKHEVPKDLLLTIQKLDNKLQNFNLRLYRADFVFTKEGEYKLIELNSRPGVMNEDIEGKDYYWDFNGKVVELISSYLK